jgi:hypothetical protein
MNTQNETAAYVSAQTAAENESHSKTYPKTVILSNPKIQIGCLLLYPQRLSNLNQQKKLWSLLETSLKHYIDLKLNEVKI